MKKPLFYLCAESAINGWMVKYFIDSRIMTIEYACLLSKSRVN
jgi:FHS family glucose/mannose:H+ symporter-like MFS transporter